MTLKKILAALAVAVLVIGAIVGWKNSASASTEECVPQDAWTETIEHPAVTHDEQVLVQEGSAAVWANFSPNNHKDPFVGPPAWPTDERGTWHIHDQIPGGHEGPDGVYAKGNPDKGGNWFYRQAATPDVYETVTIVDEEAWTEIIEHPAVECPEEPEEPVDPTDPPETEDPEVPEPDVGLAVKAVKECISQTEVKVTYYVSNDGGKFKEDRVEFYPAKPRDNCDVPEQEAAQVYSYEEGM